VKTRSDFDHRASLQRNWLQKKRIDEEPRGDDGPALTSQSTLARFFQVWCVHMIFTDTMTARKNRLTTAALSDMTHNRFFLQAARGLFRGRAMIVSTVVAATPGMAASSHHLNISKPGPVRSRT
jgi:hypothetical protein